MGRHIEQDMTLKTNLVKDGGFRRNYLNPMCPNLDWTRSTNVTRRLRGDALVRYVPETGIEQGWMGYKLEKLDLRESN